jgi:AraC-like DNA-binding protein
MMVSESTLNHKFKAETGVSPITRLNELRIDYAKGLLLKGKVLKNIAAEAGFYDQYYFSKMFKQITGTSPGKYKKMLLEKRGNI